MFRRGHLRSAYVTHDVDKATGIIGERYRIAPIEASPITFTRRAA